MGKGAKHDSGKPLAGLLYQDFPRALSLVADVATFGAKKYSRHNWKDVEGGIERYNDALHRHLLAANLVELDSESSLPHLAHAAWNVLAVLEKTLEAWEAENVL